MSGRRPSRIAVGISQADRRDRTPEPVVVLGLPRRDIAVRHRQIEQPEQPRVLPQIETPLDRDGASETIPRQRRALDPEQPDLGLVRRPRARCSDVVAPNPLDLVVIGRVPAAAEVIRRSGPELRAALQHERRHLAPLRSKRQWQRKVGREPPFTGLGARDIGEVGHLLIGSVIGAQRDDCRRSGLPECDSQCLGSSVWYRRERGSIRRVGLRDPVRHAAGDSGNPGITATSTSRAAAATAASGEASGLASSKAYGRERRSIALTASWTAACTIAYMRASTRPFPLMCRHAAVAAFAAFSFHKVTASAAAALGR